MAGTHAAVRLPIISGGLLPTILLALRSDCRLNLVVRGKWLQRIRRLHTWLGVFFSPLLLLFIVTGWWQTFVTDEDRDKGAFNSAMGKISNIHTDDYFERTGGSHHASGTFKILVACMAVSLILTILLGLALACQNKKGMAWLAVAFVLGIIIPVLILYFN